MIEEKTGYYQVTDTGKKEFALYSTQAMSNWIMTIMGSAIVSFAVTLYVRVLPVEAVALLGALFGGTLILVGGLFLLLGKKSKPNLSAEAKALLKEIGRH